MNDMPVVASEKLVKDFEGFIAVQGVDFQVSRGECFGLLGPNGAGKTSIVKMIYGFSPVSAGKLRVFGADIHTAAREIKARIGIVPQEDNLDPELTVLQNLVVYASYFRIKKEAARQRAAEILDFMDLRDKTDALVEQLSGGLKRRLTIGRALINRPELLILDEPTTGLDPVARHLVWQRLRRLRENGTTLLLTTHYLEEAEQLCDRLLILDHGKIIEQGAPLELIQRHLGREALELGTDQPPEAVIALDLGGLLKSWHRVGDDFVLFTDQGHALCQEVTRRAMEKGITVNYQRLRPATLEDVFLKLTGGKFSETATEEAAK